ncbi:aminotransferase class V-fold PLP-dependent enzyme [Planomonospora parontospora]|uniref:aminotransferase class V-fold PLP-dependent enzyme n=1 Tax=Planomonospora parontospora TaxID=58119 RepID=UPI0016713A68|nr:aminotransferase class V-fold PLP-dependent enzyme [Planomonospora parontospora]GGL40789.1 pyoverdine biosynthesis protein PvdN [Planomonospora parontospora subsp. antibiotica]GII18215.1 pyoverdine biosynthesis protein PvdN [Planomonospora parontospora subsp. antibiotica]
MTDRNVQATSCDERGTAGNGVDRRGLLLGGALAGAGLLSAGCSSATADTPTREARAQTPRLNPRSWESVRAQFPLTRRYAHFSAFMLASHPAPVTAAIKHFRDGLDTHPQQYGLGMADFQYSDAVRKALAGYIGAKPEEIALTDSTTMGIGLVYRGLRLRAGDEVVTTEHEFYSTHESLRLRAQADGVVVRTIKLYDAPAAVSADELVSRIRAAITSRTRAVAVSWVYSSTGVKLPVKQVAAAIAEINARRDEADRVLLCVDGVHGFAAENATMQDLGCDFFMTGTHKWLFGPRGTGFVWGRPEAWARFQPVVPSFSMPAFTGWLTDQPPKGAPGDLATPGGYHSFEHRWALAKAVEFHRSIGLDRIAARVRSQADQLKEGLAGLAHVRLVTPRSAELSAGIICCAVQGLEPEAVVQKLAAEHRISAAETPYRESFVRFGPSIVTSPQEVERAIRAMAALA